MNSFVKHDEPVLIWTGKAMLDGVLTLPREAEGLVAILGLGGSFHHERIRSIASRLQVEGFATLIADLLTPDEQQFDARTGHFRVDAPFLATRVCDVVKWAHNEEATRNLPVALFGAGATGAACASASAVLPLFALALTVPRFETLRDELSDLHKPALLMFDHSPLPAQLDGLVKSGFTGSVMTVPNVSTLDDNAEAARRAAHEASAWFHRFLPVAVTA